MRILICLHNFVPNRLFGAENVALTQAVEMKRRGHDLAFFYACNVDADSKLMAMLGLADVPLYRVPYLDTKAQVLFSTRKPHVERRFRRALSEFRPDVVVFHHLVRLSLLLPLVAARRGVPSVYVAHDYYWACPSYSLYAWDADVCPGGSPSRCAKCLYIARFQRSPNRLALIVGALAMAWRNHVIKRVLPSVSFWVAPSKAVLAGLKERGVACASSACIRNGSSLAPQVSALPAKHGIRFGYIGNTARKKGLHVLAPAFRGSLGRQLVIRGFETEADRADFRASYPDLEATLELFDEDRAAFFRQIDVLVLPSVWLENQPLVILEAFAHRRPVIASRIGGIMEMVEDGKGGRLVEPNDAEALRRVALELAANPSSVDDLAGSIPTWPSWQETTDQLLCELGRIAGAVKSEKGIRC